MDQELYHQLKAIEAADPDGGQREPSEAAYAYHEKWAKETYGEEVWERYIAGGWGEAH